MRLPSLSFGRSAQTYLLFYQPKSDDPMLNRVVALFDGPFCHVELAIPERFGEEPWERLVWGSSIYQNEAVFFKQKTYQRVGYVSIALEISAQQQSQLRRYCQRHSERRTPFSLCAMYAAYLPLQLVHTHATFCSKHVARALQSVGLLRGINPSLMTPSSLYQLVASNAILQVVPSRMTPKRRPPPHEDDDDRYYNYHEDDD
jgi:hypothetical protein